MAIVLYDNKYIYPAPAYSMSETFNRTSDGTVLSSQFEITFNGTLLPDRGSPNATGGFATTLSAASAVDSTINTDDKRFGALVKKQRALRDIFTVSGEPDVGTVSGTNPSEKLLEIKTNDGTTTVMKVKPQIVNVSFVDSTHVVKTDYTITVLANEVLIDGFNPANPTFSQFDGYNLRSASDTVSVNYEGDFDETYTVTRNISAQAYKAFDTEQVGGGSNANYAPFVRAKSWVNSRKNDSNPGSAINNYSLYAPSSSYSYLGAVTSEQADQLNGSYSLQQTWKYVKTAISGVIDDYSVSLSGRSGSSVMSSGQGFEKIITVNGTLKGLAPGEAGFSAASAALATLTNNNYSVIKGRISASASPNWLNGYVASTKIFGPYSSTISENRRSSSINYSFEFKEKALDISTNGSFYDYDISVSETRKENVIAEIPIPGRSTGPIIQNINTTNTVKRTINSSFVLKSGVDGDFSSKATYRSNAKSIMTTANVWPTGTQGTDFWVTSFAESLDVNRGIYSINATVVFAGESGGI